MRRPGFGGSRRPYRWGKLRTREKAAVHKLNQIMTIMMMAMLGFRGVGAWVGRGGGGLGV